MRFNDSAHTSVQKNLPASRMIYPNTILDRAKYLFWRCYTPFHPFFRDLAIATGLVSLERKIARWGRRQDFLLGSIAPQETLRGVVEHLIANGYANHFVAWEDDGEVVSLRYVENFRYQYHIRIFEDGEIRAHYEHTPECCPFRHFKAFGLEERREEFLKLLGDKITPVTSALPAATTPGQGPYQVVVAAAGET
jgi:hypothetical protein